jgi:hypothetical protein
LVSGYDNSKGYLKYNEGIYYYDGKMLKKASASDLDLYYQDLIYLDRPEKPYLMLAELYTDIPYNVLYGGHTKEAIKNLTWYPISETYSIINDSKIDNTYGDTVYQRYDCLKTYPSTEEDLNQNVDITSFMVESHINLDDRVD